MLEEFKSFWHLPTLAGIKDTESRLIQISQLIANHIGWTSESQAIGKTDYDIPSKAVELADQFVKWDKRCLSSQKPLTTLDIVEYIHGWKTLILQRNIIQKNDTPIGIFTQAIDVTHFGIHFFKLYQIDKYFLKKNQHQNTYIINSTQCPFNLTDKQAACLFLFIRGKTIKETAQRLNISPRTVDSHLEALKIKLNCHSKSDLIEKAINSDFLYYLPQLITGLKY